MSAAKVIEVAKKYADSKYKEGTNNDTIFGKKFGLNHQPWCAMFVYEVAVEAGEGGKLEKTAACQELEAWAKRNDLIVPVSTVQAGDILLFDFYHSGVSEHTGYALGYNKNTHLIDTVEGNTAADNAGAQANGDGVYYKHRAVSTVRYVVRPKWSTK